LFTNSNLDFDNYTSIQVSFGALTTNKRSIAIQLFVLRISNSLKCVLQEFSTWTSCCTTFHLCIRWNITYEL